MGDDIDRTSEDELGAGFDAAVDGGKASVKEGEQKPEEIKPGTTDDGNTAGKVKEDGAAEAGAEKVGEEKAEKAEAPNLEKDAEERVRVQTFWDELTKLDPQSEAVADDPKFQDWLKKQNDAIKAKATQVDSVADALSVINEYRRQQATETVKPASKRRIDGDDFKDLKFVGNDGTEWDLAKFRKEYGDDIAEASIAMLERSGFARKADLDKVLADMAKKMDEVVGRNQKFEYWEAVSDQHSDGKKIAKSPEFAEWLKENAKWKRLTETRYPDDMVAAIHLFKQHAAKAVKDVKKTKDNSHLKGTLPTGSAANTAKAGKTEDDAFDEGFNSAIK